MSQFWKGPALPWGITIPSVIDSKDDLEVVKSSILWIILCGFGERVMNPTFGSMLPQLVFEPNDLSTLQQVKESVRDAVTTWDPRVEFVDFVAESQDNALYCRVLFKINIDTFHDDVQILEFNLTSDMVSK